MANIITATFTGRSRFCTTRSVFQIDKGDVLRFVGLDLPEYYEVHFSNSKNALAKRVLANGDSVVIPWEFMKHGQKEVFAWVYLTPDADTGYTPYQVTIPLNLRSDISDVQPDPEQEDIIDQLIEELQNGVEKAEESAEDSEAWAVGKRGGVDVPESDPAYHNNAKYWAGEAHTAAPVTSVNGKTGAVTLDAEDVGALPDSSTLDDIPDGSTYKRPTAAQVQQIQTNAADIQTQSGEIDQLQTDVDAIEGKIPAQASASNQLADKDFVNSSVQTNTAHFRGNWETWADVPSSATDYPADDDGNTTPTTNDYMVIQDASGYPVTAGEDALTGTWRFKYTGIWAGYGKSGWKQEYQVNETPLTAAQLAALNSGATAAIIFSVSDKLDKTGDGSDVTTAFSVAANRANISTGEKLSVIFGKIAKWFSDLGSAAFRAATGNITQGSTDLVESGAVYNGLSGKYEKPASGIPASDLSAEVQTSLDKAETALQSVPSTYRTAAEQDVIDAGKLDAPAAAGSIGQILEQGSTGPVWADRSPVVTVTGTTPTITALPGVRYVCGEVATLDITLPASGIVDVTFKSGSTATVLTITPPSGVTLKWANGFDPTALEADATYEINIMDSLGVGAQWT